VLFLKSKVLFGFDKSRRAITKEGRAIICEGQLDMITAFEAGFQNIVASQGTAFTEYHARSLKRHAEEVVLCFDSDNAGYKAAVRSFDILAPTGLVVKVAPLPAGEDPDSLIRRQGPDAFQHQLNLARDFFEYMIDFVSSTGSLNDVREKTRFAGVMAEKICLLDNPIARDAAIQRVSVRLGIPEAEYRRQVARLSKSKARNRPTDAASPAESASSLPPQNKNATQILRTVLQSREALDHLRQHATRENLAAVTGCELLEAVRASNLDLSAAPGLATFMATLSVPEERAFSEIIAMKKQQVDLSMVQQTLETLEYQGCKNLLENAQTQLKNPHLNLDDVIALQARVIALSKESNERRARLAKGKP
jgi:DNA primase